MVLTRETCPSMRPNSSQASRAIQIGAPQLLNTGETSLAPHSRGMNEDYRTVPIGSSSRFKKVIVVRLFGFQRLELDSVACFWPFVANGLSVTSPPVAGRVSGKSAE